MNSDVVEVRQIVLMDGKLKKYMVVLETMDQDVQMGGGFFHSQIR